MSQASGRPRSRLAAVLDSDLVYSFLRSKLVVAAAVMTVLLVGAAFLAPLIAPHNPYDLDAALFVSDGLLRILGGKGPKTVREWSPFVHQDDRTHADELFRLMLAERQEEMSHELRLLRPDGTSVWVGCTWQALWDEEGGLSRFAGAVVDISERKAAEEQLEAIAYYDPLTGLANRALFSRELETVLAHTRQHETPCTLLLLDLDRFKEINDTLGHATGDELLTRVAHIISRILGPHSFLARLGGDEFAIILRGVGDEATVAAVASEIVQSLSGSLTLDKGEVGIGTAAASAQLPLPEFSVGARQAGQVGHRITPPLDSSAYNRAKGCSICQGRFSPMWPHAAPGSTMETCRLPPVQPVWRSPSPR